MPRYNVTVEYTMKREIKILARDEQQAKEKACEVVDGWKDVINTDATDCEEE